MRGQHYESDEALQQTMHTWLQKGCNRPQLHGLLKFMQRWQNCLNYSGDFLE
jgi:hypothetical protein